MAQIGLPAPVPGGDREHALRRLGIVVRPHGRWEEGRASLATPVACGFGSAWTQDHAATPCYLSGGVLDEVPRTCRR